MPYDNTNSGALFPNDRKENEKHPDWTGTINVDGKEYWISAWNKTGKPGTKVEGKEFFSLSVKPKDGTKPAAKPTDQSQQTASFGTRTPAAAGPNARNDMDDEIPF